MMGSLEMGRFGDGRSAGGRFPGRSPYILRVAVKKRSSYSCSAFTNDTCCVFLAVT